MTKDFTHRIAVFSDLEALRTVMARAITHLQTSFLSAEQIAASHKVMGIDTQLVRDGTYFAVEHGDRIVGCGGWSFRATLYGGDDSVVVRAPQRLNPATDAAKIRAMYTDPEYVRHGIGALILSLCEHAARDAGFAQVELMATAAGVPLYRSQGYERVEAPQFASVDGVEVPLLRMAKRLR